MAERGVSASKQWLVDRVGFEGDECLTWPFSLTRGYGAFQCDRKKHYAHRFMCELVHGAPPSPDYEAAHSCGHGALACVNPRHLSWKTKTQNAMDCRRHGTHAKHRSSRYGKLTTEEVAEIRASDLKGCDLAVLYGVHETTISNIRTGRTRKSLNKGPTGYLIGVGSSRNP